MQLKKGDVIALGKSTASPIDVRVGKLSRFAGRLIQSGPHVQVRLEPRSGVVSGVAA